MQIAKSSAISLCRHMKRIIENATCDPRDTRTVNAIRLAKTDLRKLEKIIQENDTVSTTANDLSSHRSFPAKKNDRGSSAKGVPKTRI